jgi:hypothetical protein
VALSLHFVFEAFVATEREDMGSSDSPNKPSGTGAASERKKTQTERRRSRRLKVNQLMRLRPSDPNKEFFDDIRGTISISREGVYFQTSEPGYELGMRLFVTMPYTSPAASHSREYLAEVVRKSSLPNGLTGIGIKILTELGHSSG